MNKIDYFKKLFEIERHSILVRRLEQNQNIHISADDLMDETDLSGAELDASMHVRLLNRENLFLKKIEAALQRIREGRFGVCLECEESIEERRLEARPTTTLCLDCKEQSEFKELSHIDGRKHKSLGKAIGC